MTILWPWGVSHGLWIPCQPIDLGKPPPTEKGEWDSWFEAPQEKLRETNLVEPDFFRTKKKCRGVFKKREMYRLYSPHRHLDAGIGCGLQYRTWIRRSEAVNDDSWSSCHLSNGSVLRPTYVRCPTKHANFIYKPGCIWMKVCQHWCKLDRGPLQAHCAWKCPLASWNMQLPWLDSVPAGSQSLHKNYPTMFAWERTTCGACPTVKLVEQVCLDCVNAMICKRASQVMGFGSFRGQTGWPCSKHGSQRQNCSGAVEIGIW